MELADDPKPKLHRKKQAGSKATKKKKAGNEKDNQRNPKAFIYRSAVKAAKSKRRTLDLKTKRHRLPQVDRTPLEPPPFLVAVVGPPKVGKSTLITGLVKHFTRQTLTNHHGPVTVVSGKKRRLTFVECNNDINCMIDIAKVADLVSIIKICSCNIDI